MRKLCPNLDREDGLDTVLEVPIPEEMFGSGGSRGSCRTSATSRGGAGLQLMLGVVGAPLVPLPIEPNPDHPFTGSRLKHDPIEVSTAKYIVQQYVAAAGGEKALSSITSMYAMGKVRMSALELRTVSRLSSGSKKKQAANEGGGGVGVGEMGGFVLWQKKPWTSSALN